MSKTNGDSFRLLQNIELAPTYGLLKSLEQFFIDVYRSLKFIIATDIMFKSKLFTSIMVTENGIIKFFLQEA